MEIKIFAGEKPITITDTMTEALDERSLQPQVLLTEQVDDPQKLVAGLLESDDVEAILPVKNADAALAKFLTAFDHIQAAGGVVQNASKDILFIFRRGKWDLPKGKMDGNETPEICAAREIEEETGVSNLRLKRKICESFHIYTERGKQIIKQTHWFYFRTDSADQLLPQTDEDITEAKWINTQNISEPMADTYKSIREVMHRFFDAP